MKVKIVKGGKQVRQGDVGLFEVNGLPEGSIKKVKPEGRRIVLARGEVTGHAHALPNTMQVMEIGGIVFVCPDVDVEVQHEEHAPVQLDANTAFIVGRQVEYDPDAERLVAD